MHYSYSYAESLHSKELMERGSKEGIAFITLQAICTVQQDQPFKDH
jgi:hypothetical protein